MPDRAGCSPYQTSDDCKPIALAKTSYCPKGMKLIAGECEPDFRNIRVYDNLGETADRYTVVTPDDVYSMSRDVNMPNGVNMYLGPRNEFGKDLNYLGRRLHPRDVPDVIKKAIRRRLLNE